MPTSNRISRCPAADTELPEIIATFQHYGRVTGQVPDGSRHRASASQCTVTPSTDRNSHFSTTATTQPNR